MDAVLLILAFLLCTILPFALAKLWWWMWLWVYIAVGLALFELVAFLVTKKTISQQFWAWLKKPESKKMKWIILAGMVTFWGFLLAHLFLG